MPRVSVVIPLYNKEGYIAHTLSSVLSQTLRDLQIIVVDDGSTDRSATIAQEFQDRRVRLISQTNAGVEQARNTGFAVSDSQFVVFLDADDLIYPHCLERQCQRFERDPTLVAVATWAHRINTRGRVTGRIRCPRSDSNIRYLMGFSNPFVNSSVMCSRKAVVSMGGYDTARGPRFAEDYDFWLRLSGRGRLAAIPRFLTAYRVLDESRSRSSLQQLQTSANLLALDYLTQTFGLRDSQALRELIDVLNSVKDARNRKLTYRELSRYLIDIQPLLTRSSKPSSLLLLRQRVDLLARCLLFRRNPQQKITASQ